MDQSLLIWVHKAYHFVSCIHHWIATTSLPVQFLRLCPITGTGALVSLYLNDNMLTGGLPTLWAEDKDATSTTDTVNVENNLLTENMDKEICNLSIFDRGQMVELGTEWLKRQQALTIYHHGHHPLLGAGILDHKYEWYLRQIHQGYYGQ